MWASACPQCVYVEVRGQLLGVRFELRSSGLCSRSLHPIGFTMAYPQDFNEFGLVGAVKYH